METNLLGKTNALAVFRTVAENPGCTQGFVTGSKGNRIQSKADRLSELTAAGLFTESSSEFRGMPSKSYTLTPKGEILWNLIQTIDKL